MNVGEKMKKVIKSCPNCDKLIEFSSDDKKVKCKNCKSTYIIQRGKDDNINLVLDNVNELLFQCDTGIVVIMSVSDRETHFQVYIR